MVRNTRYDSEPALVEQIAQQVKFLGDLLGSIHSQVGQTVPLHSSFRTFELLFVIRQSSGYSICGLQISALLFLFFFLANFCYVVTQKNPLQLMQMTFVQKKQGKKNYKIAIFRQIGSKRSPPKITGFLKFSTFPSYPQPNSANSSCE